MRTTTMATTNQPKANNYLNNYRIVKGEFTSIFGAYKVVYNAYKECKKDFVGMAVPTLEQLKASGWADKYVAYANEKLNKKGQMSIFKAYQFIWKNRDELAKVATLKATKVQTEKPQPQATEKPQPKNRKNQQVAIAA